MDGIHVWMFDLAGGFGFTLKSPNSEFIDRHFIVQNFDGDGLFRQKVDTFPHGAGAAFAKVSNDFIFLDEPPTDHFFDG